MVGRKRSGWEGEAHDIVKCAALLHEMMKGCACSRTDDAFCPAFTFRVGVVTDFCIKEGSSI